MMEPRADDATPNTRRKTLALNLDPLSDGVFSEAGGGQEVARWFFEVGGTASTVAKTISAYDMAMGDALYGPAQRYVSRQREINAPPWPRQRSRHESAKLHRITRPVAGDI